MAAAAMLSGCRKPEMRRCVDEHNVVVADALCDAQPGMQPQNHGSGMPMFIPYRYYYGGYGGYGLGSMVGGGGYVAAPGRTYANSAGARSGTSRGGFGSSFSSGGSHGGGSGE